jgi:hypothetical protein
MKLTKKKFASQRTKLKNFRQKKGARLLSFPIQVEVGNSLPWHGQKGNELQFRLPSSVDQLIKDGYLLQITK